MSIEVYPLYHKDNITGRKLDDLLFSRRGTTESPAGDSNESSPPEQNRILNEREQSQAIERDRLRDFSVQLREPGEHFAKAPASPNVPSFKLGDTPGFQGKVENLSERPSMGHLSPEAHQEFKHHMLAASKAPDSRSRESHTRQAAQTVSRDYLNAKGLANMTGDDVRRGVIHQMRSQIVMNMRSLGQALGLTTTTSHVVSYGLERALEREGFVVMANRAIDSIANRATTLAGSAKDSAMKFVSTQPDVYRASTASTSAATGMRHSMQQTLHNSMNALKGLGANRETLKNSLRQNMGKFMILAEVAQHPQAFQRMAQIIAKSPDAFNAVYNVATDRELRQAAGTLMVTVGESAGGKIWRGGAAVAVVAGSAMRGDSAGQTGRHAFVAAMSIAGSVAGTAFGALGLNPFTAAIGTVLGAEGGAYLAEAVLHYWDRWAGREAPTQQLVNQQEVKQSLDTIAQRGGEGMRGYAQTALASAGVGQAPSTTHKLGHTSQAFESGSGGAGTISSGKGDHGGVSYGTYQLSSNAGTLQSFLLKSGYAEQFRGLQAGTAEFNTKWKEIAKNDPKFGDAQHTFIKQTHYDPAITGLRQAGIDLSKHGAAVQEAVWSTATQFGAGNSNHGAVALIRNALGGKDASSMTDKQIVTAIQDYKIANNDKLFASSSANVRTGTANRAEAEKTKLISLAGSSGISPLKGNKPGSSSTRDTGREMERTYGGGRLAGMV